MENEKDAFKKVKQLINKMTNLLLKIGMFYQDEFRYNIEVHFEGVGSIQLSIYDLEEKKFIIRETTNYFCFCVKTEYKPNFNNRTQRLGKSKTIIEVEVPQEKEILELEEKLQEFIKHIIFYDKKNRDE